jgi:hypothetical protein
MYYLKVYNFTHTFVRRVFFTYERRNPRHRTSGSHQTQRSHTHSTHRSEVEEQDGVDESEGEAIQRPDVAQVKQLWTEQESETTVEMRKSETSGMRGKHSQWTLVTHRHTQTETQEHIGDA